MPAFPSDRYMGATPAFLDIPGVDIVPEPGTATLLLVVCPLASQVFRRNRLTPCARQPIPHTAA